ncbi:MAG: hypothetical protein IJE87_00595 [Firmicutes bacterium]|nr:hypothetical protein [Bacillota bacterium]
MEKVWRNYYRFSVAIALLLTCIVGFAGCGGAGSAEEQINGELNHDHCVHDMTKEEQTQVEMKLTERLKVNGVELIGEKDRDFAVSILVERGKKEFDPGTVTYKIYDLEKGYPDSTTKPMQEIIIEDYYFYDDAPCHVDDYNFDGADDFYLWLTGGAHNSQGKFFLWNQESGLFVENEALGQLTSPMVRDEFKVILEHIHVSGAEYVDVLYGWEGDELVPIRRIIQQMPSSDSLSGEVHDWYEDYWELMFERKILLSDGDWSDEDYKKLEDLSKELNVYYDPKYYGF